MTERDTAVVNQARRLRLAILNRHGYESDARLPGGGGANAIEDAARLATVTAHWGIVSELPILGGIVVIAKRGMRIALRWYINPIVEQQNAFNDAVVRSLYELQAENDRLRASIAAQEPPGNVE
jgi:hypothetical protein